MEVTVTTGLLVQSSSQIVTTNKPTSSFFTGRMLFLSPNQQCQSTEGKISHSMDLLTATSPGVFQLCLWPRFVCMNIIKCRSRTWGAEQVQDNWKHRSRLVQTPNVNTFLSYRKTFTMSFTIVHVFSQPHSKTREGFVLQKIFHVFSSETFNSETVLGFGWSFQKLHTLLPRYNISRGFKFGQLDGHYLFWIICRQLACRHCWATCAESAAPSGSRWLVFSKL